ncbi:MAG: hypothetical protein Kow0037_09800 [Calditrichia bacterium]
MSDIKPKILIVDDEYYLGQMIAQALIHEGMSAVALTDIDSAIEWLERENFDLVVSDIYLPGKNGMDLFNYSRTHFPELPFIFMTGNPDLEMAIQFLTQGGYDYILKPFMIPDFIEKVKTVLQASRERKKEKNLVKDLRKLLTRRLSELRIYQDVLESTDNGLIITDTEGFIVKINTGLENLLHLKTGELLNKPLSGLRDNFFPDLNAEDILRALRTRQTWQGELVGTSAKGERLIVSISFSAIRDEDGNVFAYGGIMKNVTRQRQMEQTLIESLRTTNLAQEAIIFGLARLAEYRDQTTGYHLERIRSYCKLLAEALLERNLFPRIIDQQFIDMIYRTAPLHDIGKVGIPDYILLKEGKLTVPEFDIIKSHTVIGYHTLNSIRKQYGDMPFLKMGIEITYCHHERWDGNGYPRGLKGAQIPLSAQILAIADVYDALTTQRSYKPAFSHKKTLKIMREENGRHFSPQIFKVFLEIEDRFDQIRQKFQENGSQELEEMLQLTKLNATI